MRQRVQEQEQSSPTISQAYDLTNPTLLAGILIGGALGGFAGYKYPKAATTVYGIGFGAGLGGIIASLIISR